jgi:ferric iron reductase protein FhuF
VRVVPDEAALLAEIRASIMDGHLEPMLRRIRDRVHLGPHTLWGSLASGIAYGLSRSSAVIEGPTLATARLLLAALGVEELVELTEQPSGGLEIQRRTCCLAFTLPEPKICPSCCIR